MPDIPVLLFVVSCSTDLLLCEEVSDARNVYPDMPACAAARRHVLQQVPAGRVTMAKCRYDPQVAHGGRAHPLPLEAMN